MNFRLSSYCSAALVAASVFLALRSWRPKAVKALLSITRT